MSYSTLPINLWMEALKIAIYILNRVPSQSVPKTLYQLWTWREPSHNYFRVWGCPIEAKVFNPNIRKLDPKTVSCHFIGYLEKSKGYLFYCPDRHMKFVETRYAAFLEDQMIRGSMSIVARNIDLEEKRSDDSRALFLVACGCGIDRARNCSANACCQFSWRGSKWKWETYSSGSNRTRCHELGGAAATSCSRNASCSGP